MPCEFKKKQHYDKSGLASLYTPELLASARFPALPTPRNVLSSTQPCPISGYSNVLQQSHWQGSAHDIQAIVRTASMSLELVAPRPTVLSPRRWHDIPQDSTRCSTTVAHLATGDWSLRHVCGRCHAFAPGCVCVVCVWPAICAQHINRQTQMRSYVLV